MARAPKSLYRCTSCGATSAKWQGQCGACGDWNTLQETAPSPASGARRKTPARNPRVEPLNAPSKPVARLSTGIAEMDRVLGGGFVPGSAVMIGGDPGIGKSTLLLQALAAMTARGHTCVYDSGEESIDQIRRRAGRLGVLTADIGVTAEDSAEGIAELISGPDAPDVVVVDSIQMLTTGAIDSSAGSPSQMRACTHTLIQAAKTSNVTLVLVGHVTKDSAIAGPKQVEHMVDAVLRFDQETDALFRVLRASKNRFGSTDEVGVFEMREDGMAEVTSPSEMFLLDRHAEASGSAIFAGVEGTRPFLIEVQTLVAPTQYGTPRRTVVGWDQARLAMVVAILQARCGLNIADSDIYLNISGGVRISEPAADLAVAAALASAASGNALQRDAVWIGEVGLGGEVRPVSRLEARLREAAKMGYRTAYAPPDRGQGTSGRPENLHGCSVTRISELSDVVSLISLAEAA